MFIQVLRWFADKMSMKPVSVDAAGSRTCSKKKAGFTIVELMVVIIIVNLLSGVAVPKCTELIEKARERVDLMKLYYLRDAIDRALYEDHVDNFASNTCGSSTNNAAALACYLSDRDGVNLFVIEIIQGAPANYQGFNDKAKGNNMCGLTYGGGFWNNALKEAGFEAVADIVADRANNNSFNEKSKLYTTKKNSVNGWTRTYPTNPIFKSRALTTTADMRFGGKGHEKDQKRLTMRVRWQGCQESSHSVEVFLYDHSTNKVLEGAFTTFSTSSGYNASTCVDKSKNPSCKGIN